VTAFQVWGCWQTVMTKQLTSNSTHLNTQDITAVTKQSENLLTHIFFKAKWWKALSSKSKAKW
jgi:hypothetical protein